MTRDPIAEMRDIADRVRRHDLPRGSHRMADVEPEEITWVWYPRIPRGKLTTLHGPPGEGKSTVAMDLAARVSAGQGMPLGGEVIDPMAVIIMSAEDGAADTIRPRLDAAGADVEHVYMLSAVPDEDGTLRPPAIPDDLDQLDSLVRQTGAGLVIVDVLDAYLAGSVDSHRSHDVRRALTPLSQLAEETGAAVLALGHLRKSSGSRALYRALGSIGIVGAARSAMVLARDPTDEDARILAPSKSNLAAEADALRLRLVDARSCARVQWEGVADVSADDLDQGGRSEEDRTATADAAEWLAELLADGPVSRREVVTAAKREGFTERVLRDAKDRLGVVAERRGKGKDHRSEWRLSSTHDVQIHTSRVGAERQPEGTKGTESKDSQLMTSEPNSTHDVPPTSRVGTGEDSV